MILEESINTVLLDLPLAVKGFSKRNSDCTYTIVLNARCTREQNQLTYQHEVDHILKDDFHSSTDADTLEKVRHA